MKQKVEKQSATPLSSVLCVEGVNCKGYGILAKYAMMEHELSLESKTVYAYLCSLSGSGTCTFPCRDTILNDLQICKSAYYKYFHQLTEQGYIRVEHKKTDKHTFAVNVYTIVSNPKKFQQKPANNALSSTYSRIWFSGLKSAGYGMIPRAVMTDGRLPLKTKGIYAYFCSLTGAGKTAFPRVEQIAFHLGINVSTYYKYMRYLTDLNYISVFQRHEKGRLHINDYCLNDMPDQEKASGKTFIFIPSQSSENQEAALVGENTLSVKIQDTAPVEENTLSMKMQDTASVEKNTLSVKMQDTGTQHMENQYPATQDTTINSISSNNGSINSLSIIKPEEEKKNDGRIDEEGKEKIVFPSMTRRQISRTIKNLLRGCPEEQPSFFLETVIDLATLQKPKKICGNFITADDFCDQINRCMEHGCFGRFFAQAVNDFSKALKAKTIKNRRGYAASVVWNALLACQVEPVSALALSHERSYDLEVFERMIMTQIL